jgi:hypothetical protein
MNFDDRDVRLLRRSLIFSTILGVITGPFTFPNQLSARQKAIVLGNLLGDGHLQLSDNKQKARLR